MGKKELRKEKKRAKNIDMGGESLSSSASG